MTHNHNAMLMEDKRTKYAEQDWLTFNNLKDKLSRLDAYPKTLEDFRIKTLGGGAVTFISIVIILVLFLLELNLYLTPYVHEELIIDISSGKKLNINFNITFPHVGCSHLSLDATDVSGEQHINIEHAIYKKRLDENGNSLHEPQSDFSITMKKSKNLTLKMSDAEKSAQKLKLDPNRCESCYGVEPEKKKCCNTCHEVREAYQMKGWNPPDPKNIEQCKREGIKGWSGPPEGCEIYGNIEVNKVAGNFHIALGQSFEKNHVHVHDINLAELLTVNTSHLINHLSFGQKIAQTVNQLDGTSFISEAGRGLASFQYYIKIIPTIYQSLDGDEIQTNQFAVTRYKREFGDHALDALTESRLPGVFFIYEFAPMMVKYAERSRSFIAFITSMCGVIGGILTVAGIVDAFIYHGYQALKDKILIGKFS